MPISLPIELERPDIGSAMVDGLRRAYEANQEAFSPEAGHNALTFGICVWQSGVFFLRDALGLLDEVVVNVVSQSLDIRAGRCRLRVLKLGDSEFDDPRASFPNSAGPASQMGRFQQMELALTTNDKAPREYLDWVLGHYGNPIDGLRAVRLQAVGSERALDGNISHWEAVVTLFDAATGTMVPMVPAATSPAAVAIPEPDVALQDDAVEKDSDLQQL